MTEHFTKNTVSADLWCAKCMKVTAHRIDHGRKGPCLTCIEKLDADHAKRPAPAPEKQRGLFS